MKNPSTLKKAVFGTAAVAALAGALVPAAASAQTYRGQYQEPAYDQRGGYYYDGCSRDQNNRSIGGGAIGAVAGAVIGGNVASRNARDEGAILGGVLGALAGSQIGKSTAACQPTRNSAYGYDQYGYNSSPYGASPYASRSYDPRYSDPRYDNRYNDQYAYGYGYDDYAYQDRAPVYAPPIASTRRSGAQDCQMAESPIYLPDGRVQKRLVRVCRDSNGQYQVVE